MRVRILCETVRLIDLKSQSNWPNLSDAHGPTPPIPQFNIKNPQSLREQTNVPVSFCKDPDYWDGQRTRGWDADS